MIKIGILSFTENIRSTYVEFVEKHEFCKIIGMSHFEKLVMLDDDFVDIENKDQLIDSSDLVFVDSASSEHLNEIIGIIRKTKHLYLINVGKFSQKDTKDLLKLSMEAGVHILFSLPHRENPTIKNVMEHIQFPTFINITENGIDESRENLLYNHLIEKIDLLLMVIGSDIYRISSCFSSDEFMNISLEFDNSVNANITINQLADENKSWIEILSPGENLKIDIKNNEVLKINKKGKNRILREYDGDITPALLIENEFNMLINAIISGEETSYNLTNYHFANILTDEILKKISYVLA